MRVRARRIRRAHTPASSALRCGFERTSDFFRAEALEAVSNLDVVEVLDADTALEAFADFADVVLEAPQRPDGSFVDLDAIADDTEAPRAVDDAAGNRAAGDEA